MERYQIRDDFIRYGVRKEAKRNENLFDPALEESGSVCFLDEGIAALNRINEKGEEQIFLYFGEKRLVGFSTALVHFFPYDWQHYINPMAFWITAKSPCVYYSMREKQFHEMMNRSHLFTQGVLGAAALNYLEMINKVQRMMDGNKTAQLCQWFLTCRVRQRDRYVIPRTFSFIEVAQYLNMHPVTVSRIVKKLKQEGLLGKEDGYLVLLDEEGLRELAAPQLYTGVGGEPGSIRK